MEKHKTKQIDTSLVDKAIIFAVKAHEGVPRRGRDFPYIVHPLEAMTIVATMTSEPELLAASVLHDVVEDTDFTVEERKLDGKTFTVEVYPAKDYTEQAAFYFDKDGQLVHVLVGTKDTPLVGESFFTVDPPDGKVDEKLFTTDGYTLE